MHDIEDELLTWASDPLCTSDKKARTEALKTRKLNAVGVFAGLAGAGEAGTTQS